MKKRYVVRGYSYNLKENINRTYWQGEFSLEEIKEG